jgi:hypothetical protein
MTEAACRISSAVVFLESDSLMVERQMVSGMPMASRAGAGSADPLAQVLPSEQAIPAMCRLTSNASPETPGNEMLMVFGSRGVWLP